MLCLWHSRSDDNTVNGTAVLLDEISIQVPGDPVEDISSIIKLDGADIGASRSLEIEDNEGYGAHDGNTIGCATIDRLVWYRCKAIVNVLEDCQQLIAKFHMVESISAKAQKHHTI